MALVAVDVGLELMLEPRDWETSGQEYHSCSVSLSLLNQVTIGLTASPIHMSSKNKQALQSRLKWNPKSITTCIET